MTGSYEPYDDSFPQNSNVFEDYDAEDNFVFDAYESFRKSLENRGFVYIGSGDFRRVYRRGKMVVKIPSSRHGAIDNYMEARAWHKYRNTPTPIGASLAPCRLLPNWCLMMASVQTCSREESSRLGWSRDIDKAQVGLYKGRVVAYDYALNLTERLSWERELGIPEDASFFQAEWLNYSNNRELRELNFTNH
jgi:hypothetical protein